MSSLSDVYNYTDKLKEVLVKQGTVLDISKKFKDINKNSDRIRFLQKLLLDNNLTADGGKLKLNKSNGIAESCRATGNKFYSNKQFLDALVFYNQSLCFTESGSEHVKAFAYANRSAVYYELELFDECLKNIELAKLNKYPENNLKKLEQREELCLAKINNVMSKTDKPVGSEFLKLTLQPNKRLPFIADCLELKSDERFGRYITTKANLHPGEVVCVEEPFTKFLLPSHRYKYCATCLNDNFLNLISCKNCTSTMFCSDDCVKLGNEKFHKYECEVIDKLNSLGTKILRIALRTFFEALHVCSGNVEELKSLINENQNSSRTVFDFDFPFDRKNVLQAIDALESNESARIGADLFQRSGIVAIISNLILKHSPLKHVLTTDEDQDFFKCFIFKQTQIAASNYHGLFNSVIKKSEIESNTQHGSGSFPFCSLINHSCAPNIVRVTSGCKNHIIINRPIPAGGQLFDNYGFHHCLEEFNERQSSLQSQYMFKCSCEACTKKYPLFNKLPLVDKNFDKFISGDIEKLSALDVAHAKNRFKSFCNYLAKFDKKYPCLEVSSVQECLLRCFTIFTMSEFKLKLCAK